MPINITPLKAPYLARAQSTMKRGKQYRIMLWVVLSGTEESKGLL